MEQQSRKYFCCILLFPQLDNELIKSEKFTIENVISQGILNTDGAIKSGFEKQYREKLTENMKTKDERNKKKLNDIESRVYIFM